MSFYTKIIPGGYAIYDPIRQTYIKVTEGSSDANEKRSLQIKAGLRTEIEGFAGRSVANKEFQQGYLDVADDRTFVQKMESSDFRVKLRTQDSNLERILGETDSAIQAQHQYRGMTSLEARKHDLEGMLGKKANEEIQSELIDKHLEEIDPKLERIDNLITSENWNPKGSQRIRDLLRMAREQIVEPKADSVTTQRLLGSLDSLLNKRMAEQQASIDAEVTLLQSRIMALRESNLADESDLESESDPESRLIESDAEVLGRDQDEFFEKASHEVDNDQASTASDEQANSA